MKCCMRRKTGEQLIIDARPERRFTGEFEPLDPIAGHIPGSINWSFDENLDIDGTYLPPEALRENFQAMLKGRPAWQVIHTCGSGVTACHNLLAMEIAGLPGSRLYPGSWSEWIRDPSPPGRDWRITEMLRVKTTWFKKEGERPPEEVATVMASMLWRLADKAVDNLSKADYDIITPQRGFKIIAELTCFLVHYMDRLAFDRMDDANARN
jgi:hypothetical protein